jgi:hypothetical protein
MSTAVDDGRLRKVKQPHIRRGHGLPQLLAAFPDPPSNLLIATSPPSSPQVSPTSPFQRILPKIGKPPSAPLPDLPSSSSIKKPSQSRGRKQMTHRSRSPSPDISTLLSSSVRKKKSNPHLTGRSKGGAVVEDGRESGNESTGSESSIDIHTPLP